jgi:hypothetical protein
MKVFTRIILIAKRCKQAIGLRMITKEMIIEKILQTSTDTYESVEQQLQFDFWKAENLMSLNADYNVDALIPGYFGIGSDGGGEMLTVELSSGKIYSISFIPMDSNEKILIANSIDDLI